MTARLANPKQLSKYKPEYCEQIVEFLAKGHSVGAFAGHVGVHRDTVYEWAKTFPEFDDAKTIGISKAEVFWEERLIEVATSGKDKGNITAIIFGLKNRAAIDWKDTITNELTGPGGGAIQIRASKEQRDAAVSAALRSSET